MICCTRNEEMMRRRYHRRILFCASVGKIFRVFARKHQGGRKRKEKQEKVIDVFINHVACLNGF